MRSTMKQQYLEGPKAQENFEEGAGGPALDLADTTDTAGCPVLRVLCEGRDTQMPAAALPGHDKQHGTNCIVPALAKNARTGHL
jgi:hypothetical protein